MRIRAHPCASALTILPLVTFFRSPFFFPSDYCRCGGKDGDYDTCGPKSKCGCDKCNENCWCHKRAKKLQEQNKNNEAATQCGRCGGIMPMMAHPARAAAAAAAAPSLPPYWAMSAPPLIDPRAAATAASAAAAGPAQPAAAIGRDAAMAVLGFTNEFTYVLQPTKRTEPGRTSSAQFKKIPKFVAVESFTTLIKVMPMIKDRDQVSEHACASVRIRAHPCASVRIRAHPCSLVRTPVLSVQLFWLNEQLRGHVWLQAAGFGRDFCDSYKDMVEEEEEDQHETVAGVLAAVRTLCRTCKVPSVERTLRASCKALAKRLDKIVFNLAAHANPTGPAGIEAEKNEKEKENAAARR